MKIENKMMLTAGAAENVQKVRATAEEKFLNSEKPHPNVVGIGTGVKWKDGKPTGEPAVLVLVTHKVGKETLSKGELIPAKVGTMQTDVLAIGYPIAGNDAVIDAGAETLAKRLRPARGGYSVGHKNITAGTIATCVYDILPGGGTNPPVHGVGIPPKYYILSNNHVLANVNAGLVGDAVLQPGPYDGGTDPADRIATLTRFVPITMNPPTPLAQHNNLVDCAIAEGQFDDLNREVYWNGYGGGQVARLREQIVTTNMSAGGDSGSLVLTLDNLAVGLLFAGSATSMIAN